MTILAFESSAKAASVAVCKDGELISQYTQCNALTHSRTLLPMCEDMLKNTGMTLHDIDVIACAQGPGSFTGIRIGIATVKGLAWALNIPCIGVSTLEAMAWHGISSGGYICCVMDARRSQVYNALFRIENGVPVRVTEDRAISLEELISDVKELNEPVTLVGDGIAVTSKALSDAGLVFSIVPANLAMQSAWGVAAAAGGKNTCAADALIPVYLRLSQAERERRERLAAEEAAAGSVVN